MQGPVVINARRLARHLIKHQSIAHSYRDIYIRTTSPTPEVDHLSNYKTIPLILQQSTIASLYASLPHQPREQSRRQTDRTNQQTNMISAILLVIITIFRTSYHLSPYQIVHQS